MVHNSMGTFYLVAWGLDSILSIPLWGFGLWVWVDVILSLFIAEDKKLVVMETDRYFASLIKCKSA